MGRELFRIVYGRVAPSILTIFTILNLCISFVFAGEAVPESNSENRIAIQKLSFYLSQVENSARTRRQWGGGILLGIGAASAIGGIATAAAGASAEIPISLGATAVVLGGIGAFIRTSPTDQELLPPAFREMSEASPLKVAEKRMLGETYLSIFGQQAKRNRLLGAASNIALGAALIGWYVSENQGSYRTVNPFLLCEGALFGSLGIVSLFVETEMEAALKEYNKFQEGQGRLVLSNVKFGVYPMPSGGLATLSLMF